MQPPHVLVDPQERITPPVASWRDSAIAGGLQNVLGEARGRLEVVLPSSHRVMLGSGDEAPARLVLHSYIVLWRLATRGSLGPAESYLRGEIDTPNLGAVLRFFLRNYAAIDGAGSSLFKFKPRMPDIIWHRRRENSLKGSRRNIAAHYDLGNDFYRLWLDPGMTYSSALYRDAAMSLEAAQNEKYNVVLDALGDIDGKTLLEIGCGWGGLAERAIARGASVVGVTLSTEQLNYARERLVKSADRADLSLQDYRATEGSFDAIASVEMIEAVGESHWPTYFKTLHDRLKPGGAAAIQAITIDERYFDSYRRQTDFIQRYIFPGGMLPTITRMCEEAEAAGLTFETVERFGQSYARTLVEWRSRFRAAWPEIQKQGFDERFRRMWEYYMTYCEVGFESGDVDVGIYKVTRRAR
ncbi:MAG: class I SAM-dependent methyltransferase [Hyphomicrobium sp.]